MRPPRLNWFSFAFGIYVAIPVVGIGAVLFGWPIGESIVIGVGLVVLLTVCVVAPRPPLCLSRSRLNVVLTLIPTVAIIVFAVMLSIGRIPTEYSNTLVDLLVLVGFGLAGLAMYVSADNRTVSHVRSSESVLVEWTATPTGSHVRRLRVVYIAIGGMFLVGGFALAVLNRINEVGFLLPTMGVSILIQIVALGRSKDATAFESGLAIHRSGAVHTAFFPWDRFTGFEYTDEKLVLSRRLPLASIHCDLANVDDPEGVEETLRDLISGL